MRKSKNQPDQVKFQGFETLEITADIMIAGSIETNRTINVYFTEQTEQGWLTFLLRLIVPGTEAVPEVVRSIGELDDP